MEATVTACRAALDVDARQSEHGRLRGLGLDGCGRNRAEQGAAALERGGILPVGMQPVVTDPLEAIGQDVHEVAAQELDGRQSHDSLPVATRAISPSESDDAVVE